MTLEQLKKAVSAANDALLSGEGVDLLYYLEFTGDPDDKAARDLLAEVLNEYPSKLQRTK